MSPLAGRVDDAVKRLVVRDVPFEHSRPECTLGLQASGIEHDHARSVISRGPTIMLDCGSSEAVDRTDVLAGGEHLAQPVRERGRVVVR